MNARQKYYAELIQKIHAQGMNPSEITLRIANDPPGQDMDHMWVDRKYHPVLRAWWWVERKILHVWRCVSSRGWWADRWYQLRTGVDRMDTYSLDYTFFSWFLPRLKLFRSLSDEPYFGIPSFLCEGIDYSDPRIDNLPKELDAMAKWLWIIDEMIWAMEFALNEEISDSVDDWAWIRYHNGMYLFSDYLRHLWW